ncbi:MAG: hypothetical protein ILP16_01000 [Spirochaetales bacterium]|nr:hypothetical protein [Spirochaetales bacterium]
MENAIIEQIKKENPDKKIFKGRISFLDADKNPVEMEFIYRKPTVTDMEMFTRETQKSSSFSAQQNLLVRLVLWPGKDGIQEFGEKLRDYPIAVANFVDEVITPFFGSAIKSESCPL